MITEGEISSSLIGKQFLFRRGSSYFVGILTEVRIGCARFSKLELLCLKSVNRVGLTVRAKCPGFFKSPYKVRQKWDDVSISTDFFISRIE